MDLQVGVIHFSPTLVPFPLLADPSSYVADTYDLTVPEEREFWLSLLARNVPGVVEKVRPLLGAGGAAHACRHRHWLLCSACH